MLPFWVCGVLSIVPNNYSIPLARRTRIDCDDASHPPLTRQSPRPTRAAHPNRLRPPTSLATRRRPNIVPLAQRIRTDCDSILATPFCATPAKRLCERRTVRRVPSRARRAANNTQRLAAQRLRAAPGIRIARHLSHRGRSRFRHAERSGTTICTAFRRLRGCVCGDVMTGFTHRSFRSQAREWPLIPARAHAAQCRVLRARCVLTV